MFLLLIFITRAEKNYWGKVEKGRDYVKVNTVRRFNKRVQENVYVRVYRG